jgi:CRP-like cAMP-binding protein
LNGNGLESVNQQVRDVGFSPGDVIVHQGQPADRLFIVAVGIVKLTGVTEKGDPFLLDVLGPGEHFGSIAGFGPDRFEETVVTESELCVLTIAADRFRAILNSHSAVALRTVEVLSNRLRLAQELVRQMGGYPAESRIAYILLRLAERFGTSWEGNTLIDVPLSREEIASMVGVTTETASRIVSKLQRKGLIVTGRRWVALTDQQALRRLVPEA